MTKEFVNYKQALALKELGFDEPCFGYYLASTLFISNDIVYNSTDIPVIKAPFYQQAARYLYIKSNNKINIQLNGSDDIEELNRKIKQGIQDLRNLQNNKSNQ
jgi:hypothetical protein